MAYQRIISIGTIAILAAALGGCQQAKVDMSEMMEMPQRPAELDQLAQFVGDWEGSATMTMPGMEGTSESSGVESVAWEADKWAVLSRYTYQTDDGDMLGVSIMYWDPQAKCFRSTMVDNMGNVGEGTSTYDEATKTWRMKGEGRNLFSNQRTKGEGSVKFIDAGTQEWEWTEWDAKKHQELMSFTGSSHRK